MTPSNTDSSGFTFVQFIVVLLFANHCFLASCYNIDPIFGRTAHENCLLDACESRLYEADHDSFECHAQDNLMSNEAVPFKNKDEYYDVPNNMGKKFLEGTDWDNSMNFKRAKRSSGYLNPYLDGNYDNEDNNSDDYLEVLKSQVVGNARRVSFNKPSRDTARTMQYDASNSNFNQRSAVPILPMRLNPAPRFNSNGKPYTFNVKDVTCVNNRIKLTSVGQICYHEMRAFAHLIRKIDLSNNSITTLRQDDFAPYSCLRKLELCYNNLQFIEDGAFRGLSQLRRLDLSHNKLVAVTGKQLSGLSHLRNIKLKNNPLQTLDASFYSALPSLVFIDLSSTELVCDCRLAWLLGAVRATDRAKLRLPRTSSCAQPPSLAGTALRSLKPSQLSCDVNAGSISDGVLHLDPDWDQVVFAGDSLSLRCFISWPYHDNLTGNSNPINKRPKKLPNVKTNIYWYRDDVLLNPVNNASEHSQSVFSYSQRDDSKAMITTLKPHIVASNNASRVNHFSKGDKTGGEGIYVRTNSGPDSVESLVEIKELEKSHAGQWSCRVQINDEAPMVSTDQQSSASTQNGAQSSYSQKLDEKRKSLSIYVIHNNTKYCAANETLDNKGRLSWPYTVAGVEISLPCFYKSHHLGQNKPKAYHTCDVTGTWVALNTSECAYVSDVTRILEQFSVTNITESKTSLDHSVRALHNFTAGRILKDPDDLVFLTRTLEYYAEESLKTPRKEDRPELLRKNYPKESTFGVSRLLIDLVAMALFSSKSNLTAAETKDRTCSRLLRVLWIVLDQDTQLSYVSTHTLHVHQRPIVAFNSHMKELTENDSQAPSANMSNARQNKKVAKIFNLASHLQQLKRGAGAPVAAALTSDNKESIQNIPLNHSVPNNAVKSQDHYLNVNVMDTIDDFSTQYFTTPLPLPQTTSPGINAANDVQSSTSTPVLTSPRSFNKAASLNVTSLFSNNTFNVSLESMLSFMNRTAKTHNLFDGIFCMFFKRSIHLSQKHLHCSSSTQSSYRPKDFLVEASIELAPPLLASLSRSLPPINFTSSTTDTNATYASTNKDPLLHHHLQVFVYETAGLFFSRSGTSNGTLQQQVTSPVLGVRLNHRPFSETLTLEDGGPVITLKASIYGDSIRPVWWNMTSSTWSTSGCKILHIVNTKVKFTCQSFGHYALLQDIAFLHVQQSYTGAAFKYNAPAVYIGSIISIFFLMVSITIWAVHHPNIRTTNKNKHSYINTWITLVLLISFFTVGIHQTENPSLCQGVGIVLHYLSSCVLLWLIVSVSNLYKKVTKALRPPHINDDPPPDVPLPPKPMLRFYLVGYGVPLILCGISVALNLQQYAGYSYCFLVWTPSLGAFYTPSIVLVSILSMFCLLTHCMLKGSIPDSYSEARANTDTTELELLDTASPNSDLPPTTSHSARTASLYQSENLNHDEMSLGCHSIESLYDGCHSPITQLRAHEVVLILSLLTWAAAAITTGAPFEAVIPFHATIFSIIYAICASSLGFFVFFFFCFVRPDVKDECSSIRRKNLWHGFGSWCGLKKDTRRPVIDQRTVNNNNNNNAAPNTESSSSNIANVTAAIAASNSATHASNTNVSNIQAAPVHNNEAPPSVHSANSPTNKSVILHTNNMISTHKINSNSLKSEVLHVPNTSLHLFNLCAATDNLDYSPEMFYNARQAGVAKRFFQRQRIKQTVKQNNLGLNQGNESDCNSSVFYKPRPTRSGNKSGSDVSGFDSTYLGASSKINNTNIHVEHSGMFSNYNSKQADKSPTPELLCVLGPNKYGSRQSSPDGKHHEDERQQHHRSYSINPNHSDDIPRIDATSAYQYSSEGTYQTPTHHRTSHAGRCIDEYKRDDHSIQMQFGPEMLEDFPATPRSSKRKGNAKDHSRSRQGRPFQQRVRPLPLAGNTSLHEADIASVSAGSDEMSSASPCLNRKDANRLKLKQSPEVTDSIPEASNSPAAPATPPKLNLGEREQSCKHSSTAQQPSWPHVLGGAAVTAAKLPHKRHAVPWQENMNAACNWDSETNDEVSCCEGAGVEKRSSHCEGASDITSNRNSMCSDVDGSSVDTSLIVGADISPPASLLVSDSPTDSPTHKNTPDDAASFSSSTFASPHRNPAPPTAFPYFKSLEAEALSANKVKVDSNSDISSNTKSNERSSKNKKKRASESKTSSGNPSENTENASTGIQIANWFFKRTKSKDQSQRKPRTPSSPLQCDPVPNDDDLFSNLNFTFKDDRSNFDYNHDELNFAAASMASSQTNYSSSSNLTPLEQLLTDSDESESVNDIDQFFSSKSSRESRANERPHHISKSNPRKTSLQMEETSSNQSRPPISAAVNTLNTTPSQISATKMSSQSTSEVDNLQIKSCTQRQDTLDNRSDIFNQEDGAVAASKGLIDFSIPQDIVHTGDASRKVFPQDQKHRLATSGDKEIKSHNISSAAKHEPCVDTVESKIAPQNACAAKPSSPENTGVTIVGERSQTYNEAQEESQNVTLTSQAPITKGRQPISSNVEHPDDDDDDVVTLESSLPSRETCV